MTAFTPFIGQFSSVDNRSHCRNPSMYVDNKVLIANTAQTFAPPAGANYAIFNATDNIYVAWTPTSPAGSTITATIPASSTTNGAGMELNPAGIYVGNLAEISIISAGTPVVSIAWYS